MGSSPSKEEEEKRQKEEEEAEKKRTESDEQQKRQIRETERLLRSLRVHERHLEETRREWEAEKNRIAVERQQLEEKQRQYERQKQEEEELTFMKELNLGKITPNLPLINDLRRAFYLGSPLKKLPQAPYESIELNKSSHEFSKIAAIFKNSNKPYFKITKIDKIKNPFHLMKQRRRRDDYRIREPMMFHGTKEEFIEGICTYNFDKSKVEAHKFGKGISFSRDAYYATHYHMDNKYKNAKVMVVAKVFYGKLPEGDERTVVPEAPYYTTTNDDTSVIVKYDDASYIPLYVIYYEGMHPPKTSRSIQPAF